MSPLLRFAPSPNGRLHLGHAYSALLNDRMARERGGTWLLRLEDIDPARATPERIAGVEEDLRWLGLAWPEPVRRQSAHLDLYRAAAKRLRDAGLLYPCTCTRGAIAEAVREREAGGRAWPRDPDGTPLYPGTCRPVSAGVPFTNPRPRHAEEARHAPSRSTHDGGACFETRPMGAPQHDEVGDSDFLSGSDKVGEPCAWRIDMARATALAGALTWTRFDRDGAESIVDAAPERWGDAVLVRKDTPTSYHLAVVVDDAEQGITHVVRGRDLEAATDLHGLVAALLGLVPPRYHHHALIREPDGEKLAKSRDSESLASLRERGATAASIRARLGFP